MGLAIGIVGGLGPYAGLDLIKKVHDSVDARSDQDYPDVYLVSSPRLIPDRSLYIKNPDTQNPSVGIAHCVKQLAKLGATHIGIPCNTAHAAIIMNQVKAFVEIEGINVTLHHIVEESYRFVKENFQGCSVGLLATAGTYHSKVYKTAFESEGLFQIVEPEDEDKVKVWDAIYSREFGIKAWSNPVQQRAVDNLREATERMVADKKVQVVIMGCTEIPLAMGRLKLPITLIDPALILARSLVRAVMPNRLKPL